MVRKPDEEDWKTVTLCPTPDDLALIESMIGKDQRTRFVDHLDTGCTFPDEHLPVKGILDRIVIFNEGDKIKSIVYDSGKNRICAVDKAKDDDGKKMTKERSEVVLVLDEDIQADNGETQFRFRGYGCKDDRSIGFDMPTSEAIGSKKFKAKLVNYAGGDNTVGALDLTAV